MSETREYVISQQQMDRGYAEFSLREAVEYARGQLGWWRTFVVLLTEMGR